MTKKKLMQIVTFAAVCAALSKNENDYDVSKGDTAAMKAFICLNRLKLICKLYNGDKKPNLADTSQYKYYPWAWIEEKAEDDSRPFGFRLSYLAFVYDGSNSNLGARPYLLESDYVEHVFKTFKQEYEQWIYWENMSFQED